jgi:holin-like protein
MKLSFQISFLFAICLFSEMISFHFPSSIIAMLILIFLLYLKVVKLSSIQAITDILIKNMAFFFIPAGVKIIDKYSFIKDYIGPIFIIIVITIILTFAATAYTIILITKIQEKFMSSKKINIRGKN